MPHHDDTAGPTAERLAKACEFSADGKRVTSKFYDEVGHSKSSRRFVMHDSPLARAWKRQKISPEEYYSLRRYAHHWAAAGLAGGLQSVDLDRVFVHDPMNMGLSRSERQQYHRDTYDAARIEIGRRPAFVADYVACAGCTLIEVGLMLGYQSEAHGRRAATEILGEAGHRLAVFWKAS